VIRVKDQFWLGPPPRLLAGAALLFWGAMTANPLIGFILAIVLEARQWIKIRWEFGEPGYVKTWYLTIFFILAGAVLIWFSDDGLKGILRFIRWAPLMLLPLELAQRYGTEGKIALNSLFLAARRRMLKDFAEGRNSTIFYIHTGYYYFGIVLVASSMSRSTNWQHQLGCVVLLLWALIGIAHYRKIRWQSIIVPLLFVLLVGWFAQIKGTDVWKKMSRHRGGAYEPNGDLLTQVTTRIGTLGSIKNSKKIKWRLWTEEEPPSLLRLNTYNSYNNSGPLKGGTWNNLVVNPAYRSVDDSFETGIAVGASRDLYVFHPDHVKRSLSLAGMQQLHLRSTQFVKNKQSTLILSPMGTVVLGDTLGDNTLPESNDLGVIRVINREAIIDYKLWVDTEQNLLDGTVQEGFDLEIPSSETDVLESIVQQLGLRDVSDAQKISLLRKWFYTQFQYTKHLPPERGNLAANGSTPLKDFLTIHKAGHCEYFGTAATLLLRQAGVPSRYCVGYSVSEQSVLNKGMWIMRGTHSHAWSSAFIDGKWIDVDLTPPGWSDGASFDAWLTALKDWVQGIQEELRLLKIKGISDFTVTLFMSLSGVLLTIIVGFRLWLSRPKATKRLQLKQEHKTSLHTLERKWRRSLGERPYGMTLPQWLRRSHGILDVDKEDLETAIHLHQATRFSNSILDVTLSMQLKDIVKRLKKSKVIKAKPTVH